ncbi:DUF2238 domain-containing protein [Flavobacteriales bacterium]|nr:DUF2238 domain-containing protein [Flavobacteriales bacterium]
MKKLKINLTILYVIFSLILIYYSPSNREYLYLNNIGTLFLLFLMIIDIQKEVLSKLGFIGLLVFSAFHSLGACYLYQNVPYNEWMIYLFNFDCNSFFGFERNHYDRLVHFSFGVLLLASSRDLIMRLSKFNTKQALLVALLSIQAFSMLYELFEWGIAISLSEGAADSYNGQQGDMWDAHKDMALAMIGSVLAFLFLKRNKTI